MAFAGVKVAEVASVISAKPALVLVVDTCHWYCIVALPFAAATDEVIADGIPVPQIALPPPAIVPAVNGK
jgi:hypothetical protein